MFLVTVHDPYSEHPHLSDEEFRCDTEAAAVGRYVEHSGEDERDSLAALIEGEDLEWTDPETGVEVTAHRVGEPVGSAAR
jgi:hypothetical protein